MSVYDTLAQLISSSFGVPVEEVRPDVTFSELEFDSLALVELGLAAQQEFGVAITDEELSSGDTVSRAVDIIESKVMAQR